MAAERQMRARQELHGPSLPLSWSTAFPPVVWWFLPDHRRCNLHREVVAELPQLLRRPGVLEENLVDVEGVKRAGTVAIDGLANAGDKASQLRLVVLRDHGACCSSFRLVGHEYEATQSPASQRHYRMGRADRGMRGNQHGTPRSRSTARPPGLHHDVPVTMTMPQELSDHLATDVEQRSFPWRRSESEAALHDDEPTLELLRRLGDRVDRGTTRAVVREELSAGRVVPAFVAAMIWGYGTTGYGPVRVRWVLTGVRGRASAAVAIRTDVSEKLADGAQVALDRGPNAAPILDAQVAGWLRAKQGVVSLRVDKTRDYESYLQLLKEWGQRSGRAPAQVEAGIFHLATGR